MKKIQHGIVYGMITLLYIFALLAIADTIPSIEGKVIVNTLAITPIYVMVIGMAYAIMAD